MKRKKVNEAVIVAYGRTPYCKAKKGFLKDVNPVEYGAQALLGVLKKVPELNPEEIDDILVGCARPTGVQGFNIARLIAFRAQLPESIPAQTVCRFCGSSVTTVAQAAYAIMCGEEDIIVAGGVESMSMVPMYSPPETFNPWLQEHAPGAYMPMGITAENVAQRYHVTREEMDAMAVESNSKAAAAQDAGWFDDQIIPITIENSDGSLRTLCRDECIRRGSTMDIVSGIKPCFLEHGTVTSATSSQMTDGASFVVMMSAERAKAMDIKPIARFVSSAAGGVPAEIMGMGPVKAVPKAMKKAGLTVNDMDVIELNEAFASQSIACMRELNMDRSIVNPYGGAMALGHPLGASGAMLICKALSYLSRTGGRFGLVTMCIGGGQGVAAIFEMLS